MASAISKKRDSARMQVRRYVMDLIYRYIGEAVRLPSNDDLARELGIARSTAQLELKLLIREGFLESRPGIGTFTKPNFHWKRERLPMVAILNRDGKIIYQPYYDVSMQAHLSMELAKIPALIQEIRLCSERENDLFEELRSVWCEAVVCISPPERYAGVLKRLSEIRPVVTVDSRLPEIDSVELDRYAKGREIGRQLLSEGRRRPLFSQGERYRNTTFRGCRDVFAESGIELPDSCFFDPRELEKLEESLKRGWRPDAALLAIEATSEGVRLLRQYGVDLNRECRLFSFMYFPAIMKEPVTMIEFPFRKFAEETVKIVRKRLTGDRVSPEHIIFNAKYQFNPKLQEEQGE